MSLVIVLKPDETLEFTGPAKIRCKRFKSYRTRVVIEAPDTTIVNRLMVNTKVEAK